MWTTLLQSSLAASKADPASRFMQLATLRRGNDGPANRTVVFRRFSGDGSSLAFTTDGRTEKVRQLREDPRAELCWYIAHTREQFRLSGTVALWSRDACDGLPRSQECVLREAVFQSMSDKVLQQQFPVKLQQKEEEEEYDRRLSDPYFVLCVFHPREVDYWNVDTNVHRRWRLDEAREEWREECPLDPPL